MASDLRHGLDWPETSQEEPTDGLDMARGVCLGVLIGLGFWVGVIILAMVIASA